jgi:hypothetical protein
MVKQVKGWEYPQDVYRNLYKDDAGVTWHLLDCKYSFGDWIEQHSNKLWKIEGQYHRGRYWVHEKLMGFILLKGC